MREIDVNAYQLTYDEYVTKANQLKDEGWAGFHVYPQRPGVTYVWAYNPILEEYRLITTKEYLTLRDLGLWEKGVDRLKGQEVKPRAPKAKEETKRVTAIREALNAARKNSKDYDSLDKNIESVIAKIVNGKL